MVKKLLAPGYDLGGSRLQGVGAPTTASDGAPRSYVDAVAVSVLAYGAVGNGSTDDTAAITSALASGRTVLLPAGRTFKVSQIHISGLSDVTLSGYGAQIVGSVLDAAIIHVEGGSRIRLLGLSLTHNATVRDGGGFGVFLDAPSMVTVRDCVITATSSAGLYVDGVVRGAISDCTVSGTMADGIHVTGASSQITVSGNQTNTTGDDGIAVVSYASDTARTRDVTITGNTVVQSRARGITCVGGSNVAITGNTIRSTKYAGLYIAQETSFDTRGVSGVILAGNTVQDANTYDSPGFQHPSILISAGSATELVRDIAITGNQVIGGGHRMIDLDGNALGPISNVVISGNQLTGPNVAAAGIEVARAADVQIVGNTVARTNGSGIYVNSSCSGVHVVDNIVHLPNQGNNTGVYGIYNNASTGRTSWNSVLPDSTKTDLDSDSSAADQSGFSENKGSIGANQIYSFAGGRSVVLIGDQAALVMANDGRLRWTEDGNAGGGTTDTGLARDSAGVLKTTNGDTGVGSLRVTKDLIVDGIGQRIFVRKTADKTINNSATLQSDNHLVAAVAASCVYTLEAHIIYDSATTPDIKFAWTGPTGATLDWTANIIAVGATGNSAAVSVASIAIGDAAAIPAGGVGSRLVARISGLLVVGGTAGNLTFRWAQNTATASDTIVRANSWMRLIREA